MKDLLVSVIIPVYNAERYISRAIDSILRQHYKNLEIILIDDGSTDTSLAICQSFAVMDNRFKLVKQENAGSGAARNLGIISATGELIYFMDSDDWIEPQLFKEVVAQYKRDSFDLFVFGYNKVSENGDVISRVVPPSIEIKDLPAEKEKLAEIFISGIGLAVWDKVFRSACIKDNQVFFSTKKRTQDFGFNMDVLPYVKKIRTADSSYYNYRLIFNIKRKFDEQIIVNHIENYNRILNYFSDDLTNYKIASYLLTLRTLWFGIVVPINIVAVESSGTVLKKEQLAQMMKGLLLANDSKVLQNGRIKGKFYLLNLLLKLHNISLLYCSARIMQFSRRKFKISN